MTNKEHLIAHEQTMEYHIVQTSIAIGQKKWEEAQYHVKQLTAAIKLFNNLINNKKWENS